VRRIIPALPPSLRYLHGEYRRLFGAPPRQDVAALKAEAQPAAFAGYHTDAVLSDS
jgi:hypothetical protein